ncbi:uncharacterized protein LOC133304948 [Gastrolobium bilobum]|uniref:uncharacterized protein LOC133304948 n=1 Tax=Gastrolobium bilobum TaxID=150636 RepID=UPI002AB22EFD|nr:uncharacterized protein LOC133304948 [Gastrolobium bilobum]
METFYNGLNGPTKSMVDVSFGGALLEKTYTEAYAILERMAVNNYQWPVERSSLTQKKAAGVWELDVVSALSAQISALNNSIKTLSLSAEAKPVNALTDAILCVFCNGPHIYDNCPQDPQSVCFIGNFNRNNNPYSNTYNPGWRNHPNLSYSQGQHHGHQQGQQQMSSDTAGRSYKALYPPGFTQLQHQPRQHTDTSSMLEGMMKDYMTRSDAIIHNQAASIKNLETQVGQLAEALRSRPQGTLPSNTEVLKKNGAEQVNAISLRSGKAKALGQVEEEKVVEEGETNDQPKEPQVAGTESIATSKPQQDQTVSKATRPPPPFPQRLQKKTDDKKYKKFLDVLKQLHINVPLVEALEQMPSYAKFMKDILEKKRKLEEYETVALTQESSQYYLNKLPPKLKDPGSFTIPCTIGNQS